MTKSKLKNEIFFPYSSWPNIYKSENISIFRAEEKTDANREI